MNFKLKTSAVLLSSVLFSQVVTAEPWVDTSNIFLRSNIQLLSDSGLINTPVTTFPLMWHDIANDISDINLYKLNDREKNAYHYIQHQLRLAKKSQKTLKLNVASDNKRFTGFGDAFRDKNNISMNSSFMSEHFAGNISTSYTHSPSDGDKGRLDGSYVAAYMGNWVFSAGMQDRWWGPAWDASLSLSNNARPIPALAISRKSAVGFDIPFTEHSIPWTVTTFMGRMDDDRVIDNTLLWGFRLNFKPTQNLEIGVTRLAQWAGEGRPSDLGTFWRVLKGEDNCGGVGPSIEECLNGEEPGNQLAGYDFRWSSSIYEQPLSVYFTMFAEDGDRKGGLSIFGEERYQLGLDTHVNFLSNNWRIYLEATDTYARCSDGVNGDGTSNIGNCYYEHHIYRTGMHFNGRTVGSSYDNDATTAVLGFISQSNNDTNYEFKFRLLQLNKDNSDRAPGNDQIGNTVTEIAENVLMLSGKIQYSYRNWRFTTGADISRSEFDNDINSENDINTYLTIEYNL